MSPEQARGESLDGRSDLFSLGCLLYEMATGVSPFRADSTMATLRRIVDEKPTAMASLSPDLPPWFVGIVERLLAKDPAQRFASAIEVSDLLEVCLSHLQQPATVTLPASLQPHSKWRRFFFNSRLSLGVLAMFAAFGFALLGMFLWQGEEAPDIAGKWTGERWGAVVLEMKSPGEYEGTYTDTSTVSVPDGGTVQLVDVKGKPGKIRLKWSAREGRYNGTWHEGKDSHGKISVRRVKDEVRGAWTTSHQSGIETQRPELAELLWVRSSPDAAVATPGIRVKLSLSSEKHSAEMLRTNLSYDGLSIMGSGLKGMIEGKASDNLTAVLAHRCRLDSFEETGKKLFDATLFVPQATMSDTSNLELSQKRLDQMQEQGVEFWLDHPRDQLPITTESGRELSQRNVDDDEK